MKSDDTDLRNAMDNLRIEQMGCAGMIPGLQRTIDLAQAEIDRLRLRLEAAQQALDRMAGGQLAIPPGRRGRPPKPRAALAVADPASRSVAAGSSWANLSPAERSMEMKRRMAVAREKRKHDAISSGAKSRWARMSKKQRAEWLGKMQAGRRRASAKQRVNGVLAGAHHGATA